LTARTPNRFDQIQRQRAKHARELLHTPDQVKPPALKIVPALEDRRIPVELRHYELATIGVRPVKEKSAAQIEIARLKRQLVRAKRKK
jgi:hypothetical protein